MKEFVDKMRKIRESSARTSEKDLPWNVAQASSFVIMTAENPKVNKLSPEENKELFESFLRKLEDDGKDYVVQKGKYGNEENSVVIFNVTDDYGRDLSRNYMQESYIYGEKSNGSFVYYLLMVDDGSSSTANSVTMFDEKPNDYWSEWNGVIYSIDFP